MGPASALVQAAQCSTAGVGLLLKSKLASNLRCRTLYQPNGQFVTDNLNDWQHSAMCECWDGRAFLPARPVVQLGLLCECAGDSRQEEVLHQYLGAMCWLPGWDPMLRFMCPCACRHVLHRQRRR